MKINYLFSGINSDDGFNDKQKEYLKKDIKDNSSITFIASLFNNYERNDLKFKESLERFKKIGIQFKNQYLIDDRKNKEEMEKYIKESDVIFLMGGSPFLGMESINKYDLVDILKNKNGITIGVSAGAMNQTNHIIYKDEFIDNKVIEYDGIGIIDISLYPHLDFTNIEYLKELFEVSRDRRIISLPNDSFIRVIDGNIEYVGDYYVVENGTIDIKGYDYIPIRHTGTVSLETERLMLRKTTKEDIDEFFYIQLNPKLRKFLGPSKLGNNLEKNRKHFDESKYEELDFYRWTIVKKEDNKLLGTIYLNIHDEKAKTAGIDYWIREDEWGKRYTTEASKCILDFAFQTLDLNRIESCGAKDNVGTWKVMEKIGLKYEGERKGAMFYYYGGIQDLVLYGLTKEEYLIDENNRV